MYSRKPENSAVQERSRNSMKMRRDSPVMPSAADLNESLRTKCFWLKSSWNSWRIATSSDSSRLGLISLLKSCSISSKSVV